MNECFDQNNKGKGVWIYILLLEFFYYYYYLLTVNYCLLFLKFLAMFPVTTKSKEVLK